MRFLRRFPRRFLKKDFPGDFIIGDSQDDRLGGALRQPLTNSTHGPLRLVVPELEVVEVGGQLVPDLAQVDLPPLARPPWMESQP